MISSGRATLHELQTVYSIEDCFDMLEVSIVDAMNRPKAKPHANRP